MRKALVAIDGSALSRELMRYAFEYAKREKIEMLHFVHVYEEHPLTAFPGMPVPIEYDERFRRDLEAEFREMVEEAAAETGNKDFPHEFSMIVGVPYNEIVKLAEEDADYQLIIVGHRGMKNLERFFIGSVAAKIVAHAPCSVLVYRPRI